MTAQSPDSLNNQNPDVCFDALSLYRVVVGQYQTAKGWGADYPYRNAPVIPPVTKRASLLWRKYIAEFTLDGAGYLTLDAYRFPLSPGSSRQVVGEQLEGDFWLEMRFRFQGPKVLVPFRAGVVVVDETEWKTDDARSLDELRSRAKANAL